MARQASENFVTTAVAAAPDFIDARKYGVVADATLAGTAATDNSTALNTLISNVSAAGGGRIGIVGGVQCENIILKKNVQLIGRSWADFLQLKPASANPLVKADPASGGASSHVAIENLRLDGNARNNCTGVICYFLDPSADAFWGYNPGIDVTIVQDAWNDPAPCFEKVFFVDGGSHGLWLGRNYTRGCRVSNCFAYACRNYGYVITGTDGFFTNSDVGACGDGFYLGAFGWNNRFTGCKSWYNVGAQAAPGTDYSGNGAGFYLTGCRGNQFTGCESQDNYGAGILMDNAARGNRFMAHTAGGDSYAAAALYSGCVYNEFEINIIWADRTLQTNGIRIDGVTTVNNVFRLNDDAGIAWSGTPVYALAQNGGVLSNNRFMGPSFGRWNEVTVFTNSWANFGVGGYSTAAYRLTANGDLQLKGVLKSGVLANAAFNIPAGVYRVTSEKDVAAKCWNGSAFVTGTVSLATNGNVVPFDGNNTAFWIDCIVPIL